MFNWQRRDSETTGSLTEGVEPSQIKTKYKSEVTNAIIANCGVDPNNHGITVFVSDYSSISRHGAKWKYVGEHRGKAEELMQKERDKNPDDFDADSGWFPTAAALAGTYTTQWGTACTTRKEYKDAVRLQSKEVVKALVNSKLRGTFDPQFVTDLELPGIPDYRLGNYVPVTINSYGITNQNLRVVNLSHSFWKSNLNSEEDEPTGFGVVDE